ncbi:MAG: V-type ATPase subunit subunit G family protein [Coriobacteriia bacterium]
MDEKVLEEIRFHQDVVNKDANSPLYQIREKELEISGRVLAARNQAEKVVSDARKAAQDTLRDAESDADKLAKKHAEDVIAQATADAEAVRLGIDGEKGELRSELDQRVADAAAFVVSAVTSA